MKNLLVNCIFYILVISSLAGCMTISDNQTIIPNSNAHQNFANKRIAILPIKAQTSLAPDSVMALRNEINRRLGKAIHNRLPTSKVLDIPDISDQLLQKNYLPVFEQLVSTYENTGIVDKRQVEKLGNGLGCDYLLLSRLKAEKLDIFISQGLGASIDLMLINAKTGEIEWGGSGEWKKGGIFGAGKASPDEAASQLVELAITSL